MHRQIFNSKHALWSFGLFAIACGGRVVDTSEGDGRETGGYSGTGATGGASAAGQGGSGGSTAGAGSDEAGGTGPGGAAGSTVGTGGSAGGFGGTTVGTGGSAGGFGGTTVGTGGSAGGFGGSGGASGGQAGVGVGGACNGGTSSTGGGTGWGGAFGTTRLPIGASGAVSIDAGSSDCPCTRRPGPGVSIRCPAGADESTAAVIGPAGGKLSLVGQQGIGVAAQLTVAPNALACEVTVTLRETSIPPPKQFSDWSPVYEITPGSVRASSLMKLRLPWGNRDGFVPRELTIYRAKDASSPFLPLPDVQGNAGFSDAGITEFGFFFVGVLKSPAQSACP
jgi:hypothetical protein